MKKSYLKFFVTFLQIIAFSLHCNNANSLAKEGLKNLDQGKKITASKYFEEALDSNKKNPIALYGKGKIMTESSLTLSLGQKLIENSLPRLDSEFKDDAILTLARSYARTNLYDKAIKLLEDNVGTNAGSPELYIDLSFYYMQNLEKTKGRNILVKGLEVNPKSIGLYSALANVDLKYFDNKISAMNSLESALKIDHNNQEIIKKIAKINYAIGNVAKTLESLDRLKGLQSDTAQKTKIDEWIAQVKIGKWQANP